MNEQGRTWAWSGVDYAAQSGHHRALDDWFLDRLRPARSDTVVDLGCGSGEFSVRLAEIVSDGRVVGVEPEPSMLEVARRHARPNLEFVGARAENVDDAIDHDSADLVVSRAMLHWLPVAAYPQVFAAVKRVLKPGGWFHSESAGAGNVPNILGLLDDLATRFGVRRPPRFPDAGAVFDLLEHAGYELPNDAVRTVAQRRHFTKAELSGLMRTQATVALTRGTSEDTSRAIVSAADACIDRLRHSDGTYDQTFVRLEILVRRPD
jgi:SAM-dependent methyltransferase